MKKGFLFSMLLLLSSFIWGQMTNITISGTIYESDGTSPADSVYVSAMGDTTYSVPMTTSSDGLYSITLTFTGAVANSFYIDAYRDDMEVKTYCSVSDSISYDGSTSYTLNLTLSCDDSIPMNEPYVETYWWQEMNDYQTVFFGFWADLPQGMDFAGGSIDFGDSSQTVSITNLSDSIPHLYADGEYKVSISLEIGDSTFNFTDSVFVEPFFDTSFFDGCFADFYYYELDTNFMNYQFEDFSWANGEDIISYFWDFDDGATSTDSMPTHLYTTPGEYEVSLTIETADCSDTYSQLLWAGDDWVWYPEDCQALFYTYYSMDTVYFEDIAYAGDGQITERHWDFGDGNEVYTVANPIHVYADTGLYTVTYEIMTDMGCASMFTEDIYVSNDADSSILFFPQYGGGAKSVKTKFHNLSGGDNSNWVWDFGDDKSLSKGFDKGAIEHTYANLGQYHVTAKKPSDNSGYAMDIDVKSDGIKVLKGYTIKGNSTIISNVVAYETVNIYPNPVSDFMKINLNEITDANVIITDATGRIIFNNNFSNTDLIEVNVNDFVSGMYLVKINTGNRIITGKFVK